MDIHREGLGVVPPDVVLALRDAFDRSDVDDFWSVWSNSAEAGLFSAYRWAGGTTGCWQSCFFGLLRIRSRRLGGRSVGGSGASMLYRVSQGDEVDADSAPFFVTSSLAPVLLSRRRLKSVADVLEGIGQQGLTQTQWDALQGCWTAVSRHGPCGPICSLDPWVDSTNGSLMLWHFSTISPGKWSSVGRMLGCIGGQNGILFPRHPFLLRTLRLSRLGFW